MIDFVVFTCIVIFLVICIFHGCRSLRQLSSHICLLMHSVTQGGSSEWTHLDLPEGLW